MVAERIIVTGILTIVVFTFFRIKLKLDKKFAEFEERERLKILQNLCYPHKWEYVDNKLECKECKLRPNR